MTPEETFGQLLEAELAAKSSTSELKGLATLAPRQALREQAVSPHRSSTPQTAGRQVGIVAPPLPLKVQRGDGAGVTRAVMITSGRGEQPAFPAG
jgi:hypothetical protein